MTSRRFSAALAGLAAACLPAHDQADLPLSEGARLELFDARGSRWPLDAMPRSPRFRLWFDAPGASSARVHAWLVEGPAPAATLADLASAAVPQRTRARLVGLDFALHEAFVELTPLVPLAEGRDYSLVFATHSGLVVRATHTSAAPGAGAALLGSLPAQGADGVPPGQADLLWLFDGEVRAEGEDGGEDGAVQLTDDSGTLQRLALDGQACRERGLPAAQCVSARLAHPLAASTSFRARLAAPLLDATGAPLAPRPLTFATGKAESAPALSPLRCRAGEIALAGLCLRLVDAEVRARVACTSPVSACLVGCGGERCGVSSLSEVALGFVRSALGPCPAVLRLVDGARQQLDVPLTLPSAPAAAPVTITLVRIPASGEGSAQAFVELLNFGSGQVSLHGASLLRDTETHGVTIDEPIPVGPGERVLLVSDDFALDAASDPAGDAGAAPSVSPGLRLVRTARPLGIAAGGTALALLDADGHFLSGAPAVGAPFPGACIARRAGASARSDAHADFALRAGADCSPGRTPLAGSADP